MRKPPTRLELVKMLDTMDGVLKEAFDVLRKRIAELEARPTLKYCGSWDRERSYVPGECVTWVGASSLKTEVL